MSKILSFRFIIMIGLAAIIAGPALISFFGKVTTPEHYGMFIRGACFVLIGLSVFTVALAVELYLRLTVRDPAFIVVGGLAFFGLFIGGGGMFDPTYVGPDLQIGEIWSGAITMMLMGLGLIITAFARYHPASKARLQPASV